MSFGTPLVSNGGGFALSGPTSLPSGWSPGQLAIAVCTIDSTANSLFASSLWIPFVDINPHDGTGGDTRTLAVFRKLQVGDVGPTFTWGGVSSRQHTWVVIVLPGALATEYGPDWSPNGDFETDVSGWLNDAFVAATFVRSTDWSSKGAASARLTFNDATALRNSGFRTALGAAGLPIVPGQSLELRADFNPVTPANGGFVRFYYYTEAGDVRGNTISALRTTPGEIVLRTTPVTVDATRVSIEVGGQSNGPFDGYFDNIVFRQVHPFANAVTRRARSAFIGATTWTAITTTVATRMLLYLARDQAGAPGGTFVASYGDGQTELLDEMSASGQVNVSYKDEAAPVTGKVYDATLDGALTSDAGVHLAIALLEDPTPAAGGIGVLVDDEWTEKPIYRKDGDVWVPWDLS